MKLRELQENIKHLKSNAELEALIPHMKVLASNRRSDDIVIELIENCRIIANNLENFKSRVILDGLLILQFVQQADKLEKSTQLLHEMQTLAKIINYKEGVAFSYTFSWYIERFKGNREKCGEELKKAVKLLNEIQEPDGFIYYFINYSYAIEEWLKNRDPSVVGILEMCVDYFYENGLYHSLTMSLGVLTVIYQLTQNKEKSMKLIRRILGDISLLSRVPVEIQSIIHYFIGVSHKLWFNLKEAEKHLIETQNILKPIYKKSIYSGYYLTTLSHLTATYALQGKLELADKRMKEVERLIEEEIVTKNLDSFSIKQITHTFNLVTFYIQSRFHGFQIERLQDLVQKIVNDVGKYYSNAMFLSEFLLNSHLSKNQLMRIKNLDNQSTNRVEHIINFLLEQTPQIKEQRIMKSISILREKQTKERMTYAEKAFADLLVAREYYKMKRFAEISPLLKKYENRLKHIEVLEMRIFMEAFIQVGAFKNGDPLGPALQYMAIKKCKLYGFTRLENKLLDYLQLQHKEIRRTV